MFRGMVSAVLGGWPAGDGKSDIYDRNNPEHQRLIDDEIKLFQQKWETLRNADMTFAGVGLGAFATRVILLPYLILVPTLLVDVAFVVAIAAYLNHMHDQPQMKAFRNQLTRLLDLYRWCESNNDANITTDEHFIKLLQTVAPHVINYEDIRLTKSIDPKIISTKFAEIMAQTPHYIPPELLIDPVRAKAIKKEDHSSWFSLFHSATGQAKRIFYNNNPSPSGGWKEWKDWTDNQISSIRSKLM